MQSKYLKNSIVFCVFFRTFNSSTILLFYKPINHQNVQLNPYMEFNYFTLLLVHNRCIIIVPLFV